jgi:hypothetical protein
MCRPRSPTWSGSGGWCWTGCGREHPDTLTTRHNLARWTGRAGDVAAARDQYAALLPVQERVLGRDHPDTLTTRHNLAFWTEVAEFARSRA